MKKRIMLSAAAIAVVAIALLLTTFGASGALKEKLYVAVEGEGKVAVIDTLRNEVMAEIDLEDEEGNHYEPHNIQVSPDGATVWVTANLAGNHDMHGFRIIKRAHAHADEGDQVIVIDTASDKVKKRITLGMDQHLSHVVFSPDGSIAYVVAQNKDVIHRIYARIFENVSTIALPAGSAPHGLRLSPDGSIAYVALMSGKALAIVDLESARTETLALDGAAVQTAVTPDGKYAVASIYDSRSVALYDIGTKSLNTIALPEGAEGPVQLYPTSDSKYVYIADQGVLGGRQANDKLYKLDLAERKIVQSILVGQAPHGVIVNDDDSRLYVSNLQGGTVSVVDAARGQELAQIPVGKAPNGLTLWKMR